MRRFNTKHVPEALDVEDIPDDIVRAAVLHCVLYGRCAYCDTHQFIISEPGRMTEQPCFECGKTNRVMG